ncbi:MAG: hypothetical protein IJ777_04530 [Clostridia bacterium]|nr:hypothetical protein [Clostridia bacterium]
MIVDGKGNLFEDRRKGASRRKNEFDANGGRREEKEDRRKASPQQLKETKKRRI